MSFLKNEFNIEVSGSSLFVYYTSNKKLGELNYYDETTMNNQ